MSGTLIPRNTLLAACIAKTAHEADVDAGKPTVAQEAIATADSCLNNAVLPTYTELLEALRRLSVCYDRYSATGRRHEIPAVNASVLLSRHDRTQAGDFSA